MEEHYKLSDSEFLQQFKDCSLAPAVFSHEAHLRLAWLNIYQEGMEKAEKGIQDQIENFVAHVGAKDKYHKTLTIVAIKAVGHFMEKSATDNFSDFLAENLQLKKDFKSLINSHYSFDIFSSKEAKTSYIKPDLVPFDV
ncbi:MAG: hypothetical protein R8P61_02145 [Bacteroidia bacterium]|nr:hypothetical protein [Bacteroidia bacterium]